MNTIHTIVEQKLHARKDYELTSDLFGGTQDSELENRLESLRGSIWGIAVKLSRLSAFGIDITQVLSVSEGSVIIDAEKQRLDLWLEEMISEGKIQGGDLDRLLITVQVRRVDASEQIQRLRELGVKLVMVAGNAAYLTDIENQSSALERFCQFIDLKSSDLLGITSTMKQRIEKRLGTEIDTSKILELQGYQKINGTLLWTYFAGQVLSDEARSYLQRRGGRGTYLCRDTDDLQCLANTHQLVVFFDATNVSEYLRRVRLFSEVPD